MAENARKGLLGKRLLIVEDDYNVADDIADALADAGAEVVGLAATVEDALELVVRDGDRLDAAVLDVNLRDERVYPVADMLAARKVPFVLTTGYDKTSIPEAYRAVPRCEKPVDKSQLIRLLSAGMKA
jgi:DNA-binding NtrC family response regulator